MIGTSRWRLAIGTSLSLFFLILALRGVQFDEVGRALIWANFRWVILALISVLLTAAAKGSRWWLLFFPHHQSVRYRKVLSILLIGQMTNIVLPARLGEIVRIYLISEIEGISRARALGTIALEKFADLLMVPMMLAVLVFVTPLPSWVQEPGFRLTLVGAGIAVILLIGLAQRERIVQLTTRSLRWLPAELPQRIGRQLELVLSSISALQHPGVAVLLIGGSIGIWILAAITNYLVFLALDLRLPFSAALLLLIVLQLGVAVPSAPGKLGVFHYLCLLTLRVFGIAREPALSYAFLLYGVVFVPLSVAGAIGLWWENLNLNQIRALALRPDP